MRKPALCICENKDADQTEIGYNTALSWLIRGYIDNNSSHHGSLITWVIVYPESTIKPVLKFNLGDKIYSKFSFGEVYRWQNAL